MVTLAVIGGGTGRPDDKSRPPTLEDEIARRTRLAKRVNGAKLSIKPSYRSSGLDRKIVIRWEIDYDGPRHPFTILKPSYQESNGSTTIHFVYNDSTGKTQYTHMASRPIYGRYDPSEQNFAISIDKKPVSGEFTVHQDEVLKAVSLDIAPMSLLFVQIEHKPLERGEARGGLLTKSLDAWTGMLWSMPTKVAPPHK